MSMQLSILIALVTAVAIVAVYRKFVERHEDDFLHTGPRSAHLVANQEHTSRLLNKIDYVGASLTIVTAIFAAITVARVLLTGLANRGM
jgi:hypothetical protein